MRIGIDLGGTKTEIAVLDEHGEVVFRRREATPFQQYEAVLALLAELVASAEAAVERRCSVGIGTPGSRSPFTGRMRNSCSQALNGKDLLADLQTLLQREIRLANDADCFALSEAVDGAGAGHGVVFGVILGTGVGGGVAIDGRLLQGANGIAGEWGHNPLPLLHEEPAPLPRCWCGRVGCNETYLSGTGLARDHLQQTGRDWRGEAIVAAAESGDPVAEACLRDYERRLAKALASVINLLDPSVIILGGGLSRLERLYRHVPGQWAAYVFSDQVRTELRRPRYGDASGVRGAAWLW